MDKYITNEKKEIERKLKEKINDYIVNGEDVKSDEVAINNIDISDYISELYGKRYPSNVAIKYIMGEYFSNNCSIQRCLESYLYDRDDKNILFGKLSAECKDLLNKYYISYYSRKGEFAPIISKVDEFEEDFSNEISSNIYLEKMNKDIIEYLTNLMIGLNCFTGDFAENPLTEGMLEANADVYDYEYECYPCYKNIKFYDLIEEYNENPYGFEDYLNEELNSNEEEINSFKHFVDVMNKDISSLIDFSKYPEIEFIFKNAKTVDEFIRIIISAEFRIGELILNLEYYPYYSYGMEKGIPYRIKKNLNCYNGGFELNDINSIDDFFKRYKNDCAEEFSLLQYFTEDMYLSVIQKIAKRFGFTIGTREINDSQSFIDKYFFTSSRKYMFDDPEDLRYDELTGFPRKRKKDYEKWIYDDWD